MFIDFPMDDPMMFPVDFPHFLVYSIHLWTALTPGAGGSTAGAMRPSGQCSCG